MLLSGCITASAAEGFVAAAESMTSTKNVDTTIRLEFQTSETAKRQSLKSTVQGFADSLLNVNSMITSDGTEIKAATDMNSAIEISLRGGMESSFSEDAGTYMSVGWAGPNGTEPILELFITENKMYVGTSIIDLVKDVVSNLGDGLGSYFSSMLDGLPESDWISMSRDELEELTGEYAGEVIPQTTEIDTEFLTGLSEKILAVIEDKYSGNIKKDGKSYTLTFGLEDFRSFAADLMALLESEQDGIYGFFKGAFGDTITEYQVEEFIASTKESLTSFDEFAEEDADRFKDVRVTIVLSDEGKGDSRVQRAAYEILVPESAIKAMAETDIAEYNSADIPEMMRVAASVEVKARGKDNLVGGDTVISITDFVQALQDASNDIFGGYDYDPGDYSYDDYDYGYDYNYDYDDDDEYTPVIEVDDFGERNKPSFDMSLAEDVLWLFEQINIGDSKASVEALLGSSTDKYEDTYIYMNDTFDVYYRDDKVASIKIPAIYEMYDQLEDPDVSLATMEDFSERINHNGQKVSYSEISGAFGTEGACIDKFATTKTYLWVDTIGGYAQIMFGEDNIALNLSGARR
jgi:hypothetical protein